ncbi:hypothetical protein KY362_03680 [Candidatus Woesearchaeota archaeon]|nr:hypothetical protein [Candidatus Woesearchaeota archaeon]
MYNEDFRERCRTAGLSYDGVCYVLSTAVHHGRLPDTWDVLAPRQPARDSYVGFLKGLDIIRGNGSVDYDRCRAFRE